MNLFMLIITVAPSLARPGTGSCPPMHQRHLPTPRPRSRPRRPRRHPPLHQRHLPTPRLWPTKSPTAPTKAPTAAPTNAPTLPNAMGIYRLLPSGAVCTSPSLRVATIAECRAAAMEFGSSYTNPNAPNADPNPFAPLIQGDWDPIAAPYGCTRTGWDNLWWFNTNPSAPAGAYNDVTNLKQRLCVATPPPTSSDCCIESDGFMCERSSVRERGWWVVHKYHHWHRQRR